MKDVFAALKKSGQILSGDLAKVAQTNERTVSVQLRPHIANGTVMACRVFDGGGKLIGTEYRVSGTVPASRPGPKINGLAKRALEQLEAA